jgi:hypothetical protein
MKYICITNIDVNTQIICTKEPMRTGPAFPKIKGLQLDWADESTWPIEVGLNGIYLRAPKYYATCDDEANISLPSVLKEISEEEWLQSKRDEFYARQPYSSWVFDEATLVWSSPIPYPTDGKTYYWNEPTVSWVEVSHDV